MEVVEGGKEISLGVVDAEDVSAHEDFGYHRQDAQFPGQMFREVLFFQGKTPPGYR